MKIMEHKVTTQHTERHSTTVHIEDSPKRVPFDPDWFDWWLMLMIYHRFLISSFFQFYVLPDQGFLWNIYRNIYKSTAVFTHVDEEYTSW